MTYPQNPIQARLNETIHELYDEPFERGEDTAKSIRLRVKKAELGWYTRRIVDDVNEIRRSSPNLSVMEFLDRVITVLESARYDIQTAGSGGRRKRAANDFTFFRTTYLKNAFYRADSRSVHDVFL